MERLCTVDELDVDHTIFCGQTFRWQRHDDGSRSCLLIDGGRPILARIAVNGDDVLFETELPTPTPSLKGKESEGEARGLLRDYFRLDVDLRALTSEFVAADPIIAPAVAAFPGLRVLRQDPVECLFSFLCASAAPLHRIRRNITQLCEVYGGQFTPHPQPLTPPGKGEHEECGTVYHAFPTVEAIADADEAVMFGFGLGYRAKFLKRAAIAVCAQGGAEWLFGLRKASHAEAKAALVSLPGVGEKIADCVCLFSLDKDGAIPGDTHVRQIVERHYLPELAGKSLTPSRYAQIGDTLRARFGPMAGWAQQYLFYLDLYEKRAWGAYDKQL